MPATSYVNFGNNGDLFHAFYVNITNTILGQGPNYVSGITIGTAGSGYQPETPITLTGVGQRRNCRGQHQPCDSLLKLSAGLRRSAWL